MAGHAPGDGVDFKAHVDAASCEHIVKFANFVLRLRNGHAITGHDNNRIGSSED
jgi:hypothetical protein